MNRRTILAAVATLPAISILPAGAGGPPGTLAGSHPDAALLDVAALAFQTRELELATHDDEDAVAAACKATDALVRQMASIPATTLDGFRAKARAASWYAQAQCPVPEGDLYIEDIATRSLLRDLLAGVPT